VIFAENGLSLLNVEGAAGADIKAVVGSTAPARARLSFRRRESLLHSGNFRQLACP
jgi:hypothetical protein